MATLNTRIALKYDLLSNWTAKDPVLLKGEIAIAEITGYNTINNDAEQTGLKTPPAVAMKVGDGSKKFSELPWVQAVAGDVYAWAKAAVKPTYKAGEIDELDNYINNIINSTDKIQDTDTFYKVGSQKDGDKHKFVLHAYKKDGVTRDSAKDITIDWSDIDETLAGESARTQGAIEDALSALTLNSTDGTGSGKFVSAVTQKDGQVSFVRSEILASDVTGVLTDDQVNGLGQLKQDVDAVEETLSHVDQAVSANNTLMTKAGVQTAVETYVNALDEQIVTQQGEGNYVTSVERTKGGKIVVTRDTLTHNKIGDWDAEVTQKLAGKQDNLPFSDNTQPSAQNYVVRKNDIADLAGAMHFEGIVNTIPPTGNYNAGDLVILKDTNKEYVFDGTNWLELGDEGTHATKAALESLEDRVEVLETNHPKDVETLRGEIGTAKQEAITTAQGNTETYVGAALDGLTATKAADAGKFATSVTQTKGQIAVSYANITPDDITGQIPQSKVANLETALAGKQEKFAAVDGTVTTENPVATKNTVVTAVDALDDQLHAIAKSGNVNDLVQTTGEYLIFNCGSASTVI